MKKLFSVILSSVIIISCFSGLWSVSGSAEANGAWYDCAGESKVTIIPKEDGVVNVSGSGTVVTKETYDLRKYDLKFNITNFTSGYIGFTIAKNEDPENFKSNFGQGTAGNRLDFLIYGLNQNLLIKQPGGGGITSQPPYNVKITTGEHTFGMRKVGNDWYPAIDGIPYGLQDPTKDQGRANNLNAWAIDTIRFGFAVNNNGNAADISVVPISRFVDTADGIGETTVVPQEDGECTLSGVDKNFLTTNAYDISTTDLSFYAGDLTGKDPYVRLAVAVPFGKTTWVVDPPNETRLEFWYYPEYNQLVLRFNATSGAKQAEFKYDNNGTNLRNKTNTFGFRYDETDAKWYPAINGKVYKIYAESKVDADGKDALDYIQSFITANGTNLRFGIAATKVDNFSVKNADLIDYTQTVGAESLASVKKYLLGADKLANKWFFDLNRDGNLDIVDLVKVKQASAEKVVA